MLGIIGAMEKEVFLLRDMLKDVEIITVAHMDFYSGKFKDKDVVIVKCGVGKVNAAMCTQALIDIFKCSAIINTGIAGSLDNDINIGDIVLSVDAMQHDMDVTALGYDRGIIPDTPLSCFVADEKLRALTKETAEKNLSKIKVFEGRVVSGDQFISGKDIKDSIVKDFGAICTEMEGAAIAQVAALNNVPFLIIRAISDKADDSAHMDYPEFQKLAIARSVKLVAGVIDRF